MVPVGALENFDFRNTWENKPERKLFMPQFFRIRKLQTASGRSLLFTRLNLKKLFSMQMWLNII